MKKILSLSIVCAILLLLCGFTVSAAGTTVSVGTATCLAGESVSIPITLSGNMGFSNLGIEIEYNDTALTLTNVTAGQTGATYTSAQSITANPYNMGWDSTSNNTFNGTIATLEFDIAANAAAGDYPITVSYYKGRNGNYEDGSDVNYDENFNSLNLSYVIGYVTVSVVNTPNKSILVKDIQNNNTLTFTANLQSNEQITGITVAAVYDINGALIAVKCNDAAIEVPFSFADIPNAVMAKVFWWDSTGGMTPQVKSKTVNL